MKKITKNQIEELAKRALESGNPYKKDAVVFMIDMIPRYIYAGETMTEEEINEAYLRTARKDIQNGYEERAVGWYDKWYRYERSDNGRAYDLGASLAAQTKGCREDLNIIEINPLYI